MPVQVTIIGLGQIGTSMGLALKARKASVHIVGHDKDPHASKAAQDAGAVDTYKYNLPDSAREAQLIILAIPLAEVRETLELIGPDLQESAVILDTALSKRTGESWAKELVPQGRYYAGLFPSLHPDHLHGIDHGTASARADLFQKSVTVATMPYGTPEPVFKLVTDFISMLGSLPLIMDSVEADGLIGKVHVLPQLASAALLDATLSQPGWQESQKIAGRPYASVTSGLAFHDDANSLRDAAIGDKENTVRLLNAYISSLINLRDEIEDGDKDALGNRLEKAWNGRARWFNDRSKADWINSGSDTVDGPTLGERMNQLFFGSIMSNNKKRK